MLPRRKLSCVNEASRIQVQDVVMKKKLRPALRTHYMRTAFQRTGDATVRFLTCR